MNLTKISKTEINQTKEVPGLLSCNVEYEVKSARGTLQYAGPKFDPEMWHQVMSFFRWTFKEMQSESQVRLYVNTKLGRWGAWAFAQAARTGMMAEELNVPETPEQARERFAVWESEPSGDWLYFCTVHHHCAAAAFQSGTDERNEQNQDGLHITVGRMDGERHDLHARFYLGGNCFEPDLSRFWPIDPELAQQLPAHLLDDVARFQMCEKVTVDFPGAWRKNLVEIKPRERPAKSNLHQEDWGLEYRPLWSQVELANEVIAHQCADAGINERDFAMALQKLSEDPVIRIIVETCLEHQLLPGDLCG
jgi:hypothetical protein